MYGVKLQEILVFSNQGSEKGQVCKNERDFSFRTGNII